MTDEGALKPNSFTIAGYLQEEESHEEPSVEEGILSTGKDKIFWKTLRKHFDKSIYDLEMMNEQAIAAGLPFDEIGRNALVISQVKGVLRKIINVVEDATPLQDGTEK